MRILTPVLAVAILISGSSIAIAQEAMGEDHDMSGGMMPAACKATDGKKMANHRMTMPKAPKMDAAHAELMDAMMGMVKPAAMQGMMAKDPDVAFVCGMIVHHQGAIDMANAELKNGDDKWAKDMAQKVIDAQTKEIADMTAWLEKQAK
ncbi:DUF305 domain-containing protein [Phyllobacterium zundukense]|uniref:DUF305 domain-containing protein n=1 Tax=Phyllobacterium zundukense TaxID=1867719 RepID=A0A2N9VZY6_9HYPH|nr:DUF305 domain-containing protein [Phyllobacterium zundukense]ATU94470.1 hypothetical protein BLM14_22355 [Phyllobacterium zundukense]PIO45054.1 hypothetical protein B5P45_09635 [Phyllobacterium zundukense]